VNEAALQPQPLEPLLRQTEQQLSALLASVYQRATRQSPAAQLPLPLIDDPLIAQQIFKQPELFGKNYAFLEAFAEGRFSRNGNEWQTRQQLTQSFYSRAVDLKKPQNVFEIYCRHLQALDIHSDAASLAQRLYNAFLAAATEVVLRAFGISESIGWSPAFTNRVLDLLKLRQLLS